MLHTSKVIIAAITLVFTSIDTLQANTIVVQNKNDSLTGSLRQAVIDVSNGDTIRFNSSLIANGSDSINLSTEIAFSKLLTIKGLYNSTDTLFISGNNTNRIFNITSVAKAVIDSMVFVNGHIIAGGGGAILFSGIDSVFIDHSKFSNSYSEYGGGVYFNTNSTNNTLTSQISLNINNSVIDNNASTGSGGGIYVGGSNVTVNINNSTINNNNNASSTYGGGGMYVFAWNAGSVIIDNSNINNNTAASNGGGIYAQSYYANFYTIINNSTIDNNTSLATGGGVYSIPKLISSVVLNNSTVSNNTANIAGGIHSGDLTYGASQSIVTLMNSTINGNHATNDFGGIASQGNSTSFTATNSTIFGNNTATSWNKCGGIYVLSVASSSMEFTSSIVWTSVGDNIKNLISFSPSPITSLGYNIFSNAPNGATAIGDLTNVSAMGLNLEALANNGGYNLTMKPGVGSVAINAGNPNDLTDAQNGPIIGVRDIGSTETSITLVSSISVQGQGGVSTITTQSGTLQMEAAVLPASADDATYTWAVVNGTGSASIDTSGVLTALTNGTVEVTATANDSSGTIGVTTITISNQSTSILVSSISIQGAGNSNTIPTAGGTLQMIATVLPANADDDTYTWSVANGTGSATISAAGLLTATTDGTVTVTATANDASGETASMVVTISNQTTGVSELSLQKVKIYPNPVQNELFIELENGQITEINILDLSGKVVFSMSKHNAKSIDVSNLKQGIYILRLYTETGVSTKRFVKQ